MVQAGCHQGLRKYGVRSTVLPYSVHTYVHDGKTKRSGPWGWGWEGRRRLCLRETEKKGKKSVRFKADPEIFVPDDSNQGL